MPRRSLVPKSLKVRYGPLQRNLDILDRVITLDHTASVMTPLLYTWRNLPARKAAIDDAGQSQNGFCLAPSPPVGNRQCLHLEALGLRHICNTTVDTILDRSNHPSHLVWFTSSLWRSGPSREWT